MIQSMIQLCNYKRSNQYGCNKIKDSKWMELLIEKVILR
jgi:hypothetical protein